jgi:hypothetical protein
MGNIVYSQGVEGLANRLIYEIVGPWACLHFFLDSSSEHDSKTSHVSIVPSLLSVDAHARRTLARTQLLLSEGGGDLASFERDIGPSEQEEPAQVR